ncbi:MAG: MJ1477/TM1410 family putative glycoside hydrolase [Pseudomonadota bacterium]|nr:MJ1477/TM1410 family putative glycoside hydrolase [Pseudomonadota bacterium]
MRIPGLSVLLAMMLAAGAARADIAAVRSFTYWLANPDPALIAASGFDLVVVDYSADGSGARAYSPADVALMQRRSDGGRRIVLSYMSIGEAEDYRFYWQKAWAKKPPAWLEDENPAWAGNFKVRYWMPEWQRLILGHPEGYLDRIIAAGFDGVYLDIVDAYWYFQEKGRTTAATEMKAFVQRLAAYARAKRPGFLVVPQNAEDLLVDPDYLATIDAQGKEDVFYGWEGDDVPNQQESIDWMMKHLRLAVNAGKPVLLIEYPTKPDLIADAYRRGRSAGFVPYVPVRALDHLVINRGLDPDLPGLLRR